MLDLIAQELKLIRTGLGLPLSKVAEDNDFKADILKQYENNGLGMTVEQLEKLLKYYNIGIDIFFISICENIHNNTIVFN